MDEFNKLFQKASEIASLGEKMWDSGILSVGLGPNPYVHLDKESFFRKFDKYEEEEFLPGGVRLFSFLPNGVKVICICWKGEIE